ncbi:MAG TPA: hypothetical protein VHL98_11735 [Microvirga sp.]|jgi:hypothetical protein|nr:hypothetical protein [Microvirga sp.]
MNTYSTNDKQQVVGFHLPIGLIREIDAMANLELMTRASWCRRALMRAIAAETRKGKAPTAAAA